MQRSKLLRSQDIKAAAIRALKGSILDLQSLANYTRDSDEFNPGLFPVFSLAVRRHKSVGASPAKAFKDAPEVAVGAKVGLRGISHVFDGWGVPDNLVDEVKEVWPAMWDWIQFFYHYKETGPQSILTPSDPRAVIGDYFFIFEGLYLISRTRDLRDWMMKTTPDLLPFLAKLWVDEVEGVEPKPGFANLFSVSKILQPFVTEPQPGWIQTVIEAAGGTVGDVAAIALKHVNASLNASELNELLFVADIFMLAGLSHENPSLTNAFLSRNSIYIITTCLSRLTTTPRPKNMSKMDSDDMRECLNVCYHYLEDYIRSTDGVTWVKQAIDSGLLQAMVKSEEWLANEAPPNNHRTEIVKVILPGYLVYSSILTSVGKELRTIQLTKMSRRSPFFVAWFRFTTLAAERLAIKKKMDDTKISWHSTCDNMKCLRTDKKAKFRRCDQCFMAMYCSPECQKLDWNTTHRIICKATKARRESGEPETISKSDFKFLAEVLKTDVAKIGPIPRGHVIKVDYKAVAITSGPSDDNRPSARETDDAGQERWDTLVKRAELSDGHYRVVVVYFPRGEMVVRRVTSLHVESDDDGVWEWEPSVNDSDGADIEETRVIVATKSV